MGGVLEQLERRLKRVEVCLDVTMAEIGVQVPGESHEFYEEAKGDGKCDRRDRRDRCDRCGLWDCTDRYAQDDRCDEDYKDPHVPGSVDWDMPVDGGIGGADEGDADEGDACDDADEAGDDGSGGYADGAGEVDDAGINAEVDTRTLTSASWKKRPERSGETERESPYIRHNEIGTLFSIKLVSPAFYHDLDIGSGRFRVKFSKTKANLAARLEPGDYLFIYVMAPEKKIIGLATVVESAIFDSEGGRWPWRLIAEWEIGPKQTGLTFRDLGIKVRPRIGDTIYSLNSGKAMEVVEDLRVLPDLTLEGLESFRSRYDRDE